jgi:hypothetical protein
LIEFTTRNIQVCRLHRARAIDDRCIRDGDSRRTATVEKFDGIRNVANRSHVIQNHVIRYFCVRWLLPKVEMVVHRMFFKTLDDVGAG